MNEDPKEQGPKPPFEEQPQEPPGLESEMTPRPDYGADTYRGHGRLEGKAAVITGGDSGIGRAVAVAFAREGADVLISYLEEEEADALETARAVEESGRRCVRVAGDIRDESHCRSIVGRAVEEFGRLDVLVNNAAFQLTHKSIQEISPGEFDRTFRTNVYAMFYLCKAALPRMREGGSIINTASIQAYQPSAELLAYASTKGAIVTFSKALASEAMKSGVRVNVVAPGPIWTPLITSTMPHEKYVEFGADTPEERPGQPSELAPVFVFLASQESSYVCGEVIGVTGGKPLP
jgi:NAD(P)-dependent dehydrogenase (short-subunit alcohol dehydrogenase family)